MHTESCAYKPISKTRISQNAWKSKALRQNHVFTNSHYCSYGLYKHLITFNAEKKQDLKAFIPLFLPNTSALLQAIVVLNTIKAYLRSPKLLLALHLYKNLCISIINQN